MTNKEKIIAVFILVIVGISYRLFPHPPNFAPVAAISLFSGFCFRRYFIAVPLGVMLISDVFIGFYDWKLMTVVYFSFALIGFLGILMRKNKSVTLLLGCSLAGSFLFFILTNFAVWALSPWYSHDWQGLTNCFTMAIPFFKNTLMGDLFYSSVIFGCYEILAQPKERLAFLWNRPGKLIHNQ
jgi:hypothetical protein